MRPKVVALIVGLAIVAAVGLSLLRTGPTQPKENSSVGSSDSVRPTGATHAHPGTATGSNTPASLSGQTPDPGIQGANTTNGKSIAKPSGPAQGQTREDYIEQRVGELMDLAMTDDPNALKTILSEISNPEGEIRKAAIEATKQFGSADAIPKLQEALSSSDTSDKQDLQEAIEFLKLPSFLAKRN